MLATILLMTALVQIEGRVLAADRNDPVAFARVVLRLLGQTVGEQHTDSLGRFRFPSAGPGRYSMAVDHPDYQPEVAEIHWLGEGVAGEVRVELRAARPEPEGPPVVMSMTDYLIPPDARKQFERGRDRMERGDCEKAIVHFEKGLRVHPNADAYNDLGNCHRKLEHLVEAEQSFRRAIELGQSPSPVLNLAEVYLWRRRFEDAEAVLDRALVESPHEGDLYYGLANVYFEQERWEEAMDMGLEACARAHQIADVHLLLAKVYLRLQNAPGVVEHLELYLREAPEGPEKDRIRKALKPSP